MHWRAESHPATLLDRVSAFLDSDPLRNNVLATVVATRRGRPVDPRALWLYGERSGTVAAVAVRTPPRALLLSAMATSAATGLARYVAERDPCLPGVDGPAAPADACAAEYSRLTGRDARPGLHNRLMALAETVPPRGVPGHQRSARDGDADVLAGWLAAFAAEALPHQPAGDPHDDLRQWLAGREVCVWEDGGEPVSLMMMSAQVAGVRRVGPVYTPPERRGRGYAAANVATAGLRALGGGAAGLMLYADAANPVSNRVYERIGYRVLDESREWLFDAA